MTTKMKIWSLIAIGIAITIFWAMLSMIFESVVFRPRSGWTFYLGIFVILLPQPEVLLHLCSFASE